MKQVLSDSILCIEGTDSLESRYRFHIVTHAQSPLVFDLSEALKEHRNDRVDYKKDYKLWNQVYAWEKELEIFQEVLEGALAENRKIHIVNCSLREEIEIIRELYHSLGYFDERENRFRVPFSTAPVTLGVNIRNLAYSSKDYKSKRESICFIPPPREPGNTKALFAAINSGVVSTVTINSLREEQSLISGLVDTEKTNLTTLAGLLGWNARDIGLAVESLEEWELSI